MVNSTFNVGDGATKNILDHPTKFLGCVLASSPKVTRSCAGKLLLENFSQKLSRLNDAQVRGEYNEWIYKRYHTNLSVFPVSEFNTFYLHHKSEKCRVRE